jgi:hypothetical protein
MARSPIMPPQSAIYQIDLTDAEKLQKAHSVANLFGMPNMAQLNLPYGSNNPMGGNGQTGFMRP